MKRWLLGGALCLTVAATAAEIKFDFGATPVGQVPTGFRSALCGAGTTGQWQVVMESAPSMFKPVFGTNSANYRAVLAQTSAVPGEERFPLLLYERDSFADFTFSARFKIVAGQAEQMAGLIFRAQDERNFYVFRANAKDGNARFYKVVNGGRTAPIGNTLSVSKGEWHQLKVECQGNQIKCYFETNLIGGGFIDTTFTSGKIGFWTMSDSVSYFADAMVAYTPSERPAQALLRLTMEKNPRLKGLRLYAPNPTNGVLVVVAATDPRDLQLSAGPSEQNAFAKGLVYHLKEGDKMSVYLPLHDHNGDTMAVTRITMQSFPGQTEQNAMARAIPILKEMEASLISLDGPLR
ncbi:MAG: family 16 glycoside hydrolase [Verrucomicrobiota bacterium]